MTLYNCHTDGDQYRITKFDSDGNVESTYLCTEEACECPAGVRPTCRHRQMLPKFIARNLVDSFLFWNFEGGYSCDVKGNALRVTMPVVEPRNGLLGEDSPKPLRYDMDYSNSVGHGPAYGLLGGLSEQAADDIQNIDWDTLAEERLEQRPRPHSPTATTTGFDPVDGGSNPPVVAKAPKIVRRI